jgi:hypothetical protein
MTHQVKDYDRWLTPLWLADLKLKAATIVDDYNDGDWIARGAEVHAYIAKDLSDLVAKASNYIEAEYIAAANPTAILAMIDKIQTLQSALEPTVHVVDFVDFIDKLDPGQRDWITANCKTIQDVWDKAPYHILVKIVEQVRKNSKLVC